MTRESRHWFVQPRGQANAPDDHDHTPAGFGPGLLLHKHPDRCQSFDLSFGKARVFYPEVGPERCSARLLLDVAPDWHGAWQESERLWHIDYRVYG